MVNTGFGIDSPLNKTCLWVCMKNIKDRSILMESGGGISIEIFFETFPIAK
jgi:hypothetical protein